MSGGVGIEKIGSKWVRRLRYAFAVDELGDL